ncbi:DUF3274 domain-containing protein [Burkholderia multivorans]|nr:DUF3274 domain-containing protein [Burkholderia multivorans]MBU9465909.1 DUF3274 domain-containing protein [Burkholderia multivorans]PRE70980.1 hypothetical protein C6P95_03735 [Burkholderia multivorans]QIX16164.1 DUF3274 domain-containing protein [Burkholderia multivorans]
MGKNMADDKKPEQVIAQGAGVLHSNRGNYKHVEIPADRPGVVIFLHGVNDPGGNYDHIEKGLCEGLNERLSRVDLKPGEYGVAFQKALKYTHKDPDFAQWRETKYDPDTYLYKRTEVTDGPGKTHSIFIPFYWGYRASPDEIKGGEKNPVTLRGQYQDKHGNRLSKHFAKGGGMFNNATTNIPAMFDPGWLDNTANQMASARMSDYQYSTDSPHRHYFVLAAKRLAMLVHEIRRVDPNETISIMAHSQGTMITLLSQAFLVEDNKERCADCVIMVDTPYGVNEPIVGDIAQPSATPYTSRGKINTLKNIVKAVTGNPWPSPKLDELKVEQQPGTPNPNYQGRTGHGWSPAQASRRDKDGSTHTFQERDNRGKVYLYFCTEDTTVDLPNIKGIGTHGVPDTVEEGWFSDKKNSIWKPIQKSKAVIPAMNDLRNLRFYQRLWTKKPSGINNGQPVLVGSTPAHYEGTYDAGLISKDIEKRWINGEAIVPPYKPNLYGDEGIKGDPNTPGRDKPDYVSRDTLLGNPNAKDIRAVVMPDVPKDVFDGGYQKVLAWFNSQSPDPEDHTDSVWLSDGGKLTYHRRETPNEVRNRLEKRDAKSWDKNSYHSAILRDSDNIRRVAAMDVAIGQAKSLDDPNVRNLLIAIADWKIDSKGMDAIENNPYYSSLDDSSKSLVKGNFFYYTQGKFPSNLVPTKPPKMVDAETYRDRAKNRQ